MTLDQTRPDVADDIEIMGRPVAWRVIVRFGEIALKRGNRGWFMRHLQDNVRRALADLPVSGVSIRPNRCFVRLDDISAWDEVRERLARVSGVTGFSLALEIPRDLEAMKQAYDALGSDGAESFRVRCRRGDKRFPVTSQEVERELGTYIQGRTGMRVDLENAELTFGLEVQKEGAFAFLDAEPGPGGLPVGTAGRVAVLLSGGIDSPVAAYRMLRRGCRAVFVHFTSFPLTDASAWDKCRALIRLLTRYQFESKLYSVRLGEIQQRIIVSTPARYRILLYRRMMLRIGDRIARQESCQALVTGESLGQVGSQTLSNMSAVEKAVDMTVLRPLIGEDKVDITRLAREIGTYETSIEPDMDCCQYLVPRSVATHSTAQELSRMEEPLDVDELVRAAVEGAEVEEFRWPES